MEEKKDILKRAYLLYFFLALFGIAVLGKVVQITLIEGKEWREKAEHLTVDFKTIEAVRGNIYAADGSLLATSVPVYEVRWDPNAEAITKELFDDKVDTLAECLANLFQDKSKREYLDQLNRARNKGERYHLIKRKVKYTQLKKLRDFPIFNKGRYKGGFLYIQQNKRQRPFRVLAARTIGYDRKGVTPVGLEGAYKEELAGVEGRGLMKKIAGGVWMPIDSENEVEPEDGSDLYTTLDVNIQDVAEHALLTQLQKHDAKYGTVVVMEVKTGRIKAIANLSKGKNGEYYENYNHAIGESAEPGSTIKLASYLALLDDKLIDLDTSEDTGNGKYKFYDTWMHDSKEGGYGVITAKEAYAYSSNIWIAKQVQKHYGSKPQDFINKLYQFRLNQPLGIEIAGEGQPFIKSANDENWSGISLPWMAHGYETKMTPLQMLTFYNAVANDGVMVKPMFAESIRKHGKIIKEFEPVVLKEKIASKEAIDKVKVMLEAVVESGTAKNLRNAAYKIAGKTGTAQLNYAVNGKRNRDKLSYQASFCGYFPADNPQYSCIVVVNAPSKSVYYGNLVAGPIFEEISDKIYSTSIEIHDELKQVQLADKIMIPISKNGHGDDLSEVFEELQIKTNKEQENMHWVSTRTGKENVTLNERKINETLIPNVKGMALEDAVYILENLGLQVSVEGRGVIRQQSIVPGEKLIKGSKILLKLA